MILPLPRSLIKLPLFLLYPLHLPFSGGKYYMKCNSDVRVLPPSLCRIRTHKYCKLIGENNTDSSSCCSHFFPWGSEIFFSFSFTLRKWHPEHVPYFVMTFLFLLLPNPPLQYKSTQFYSLYVFLNLSVSTLSSSRICLPWHFHLNTLTHLSSHAGSPTSSFPYQTVYISPLPEMASPSESKETGNHFGSDSFIIIITSHEWSSTFLKRMTVYKCERGGDNGQ